MRWKLDMCLKYTNAPALLYILTSGPTQGQLSYELEDIGLGKYHAKFEWYSMVVTKVMSS